MLLLSVLPPFPPFFAPSLASLPSYSAYSSITPIKFLDLPISPTSFSWEISRPVLLLGGHRRHLHIYSLTRKGRKARVVTLGLLTPSSSQPPVTSFHEQDQLLADP